MIEFIDVRKEYSDISALDEVSFRIESGEFVFIIGIVRAVNAFDKHMPAVFS